MVIAGGAACGRTPGESGDSDGMTGGADGTETWSGSGPMTLDGADSSTGDPQRTVCARWGTAQGSEWVPAAGAWGSAGVNYETSVWGSVEACA